MTSVALPALTPVAPVPSVSGSQLQLGQVVSGLVLAVIDQATLRLQTALGTIDVKSNAALTPGTPISISVQGTQQEPELVVSPLRNGADQAPAQATNTSGAARLQSNIEPSEAPSSNSASANSGESNAAAIHPEDIDTKSDTVARDTSTTLATVLSSATAIIRNAAASQGGLAALYANLEAVVDEPAASVPNPVVVAATQMLALRIGTASGSTVDSTAIASALMRSGAATEIQTGASSPQTGTINLGTALVVLRQALRNWIALDPETNTPSGAPLTVAAEPAPSRSAVPMPPYRGAPTVPQAPMAATISASTAPREQAIHLLGQTDAALARQTLLQIASLPGGQTDETTTKGTNAQRLMFDVPLATAQGTGVAQLAIERDSKNTARPDIAPVWRADFSIDLKPIGPVHVRIALANSRATVTMNAERSESAQQLSAGLPLLEAGLRSADIEPGGLRCNGGAPRTLPATPGTFVDQAT